MLSLEAIAHIPTLPILRPLFQIAELLLSADEKTLERNSKSLVVEYQVGRKASYIWPPHCGAVAIAQSQYKANLSLEDG